RVKVLDFGIAKLRPDWAGSDGPKTRTGVIFGTPAYMSPEQCRGLNDEVDVSTDIYALGCILFEMLCGRAPYISPGWGDVLMMHMSDEIPVASAENSRVPPAIDQVIRTALAKKKADRYPSMREMNRALAQSRNAVQDTPAPQVRTDPQIPAVVLGADGEASFGAPDTGAARAAKDTFDSQPGLTTRPRRRMLVIAGAVVVGGVAGFIAIRHSGSTTPRAQVTATPAVVAPPTVAQPAAVAPPTAREPVAPSSAEPEAAADDARLTTAKNAADGTPKIKSTTIKSAKSHHKSARRKDPAKW